MLTSVLLSWKKLQSKLNTLVGVNRKNRDDDNYLIKTAVQNYIKTLLVSKSINF